jgi:hypothetical protein
VGAALAQASRARNDAPSDGNWRAKPATSRVPRRPLTSGGRKCVLADAQFVIARSHGFESWRSSRPHLDALAHTSSETAEFEAANRCDRRRRRKRRCNGSCARSPD